MGNPEIGSVEWVGVREIWRWEDSNFTPWLADNLNVLGEAVGLQLKHCKTEAAVGSMSLDILAKETRRGVNVAIENQLETTDSDHLARLLIYAAGSCARIAIWVATEFVYEHAEVLHRLNEWTRDDVDFYGVQVRAAKVDGSRPVPQFRVVVAPGCWNKGITVPKGEIPEETRKYQEFFEPLMGDLIRAGFSSNPVQYFDRTGRVFRSGIHDDDGYAVSFWKGNAWLSRHIRLQDVDQTKRLFDELKKDQGEIERCIEGQEWQWLRHDGDGFSTINLRRDGCSIDDQPETLAETREWMLEYLPKLKEVIEDRLRRVLADLESEDAASA